MEDSLSLVSLRHDLEKAVFSLPYKDSILVVDLVRIPGGNDESFLGKIGDKNAFASQDEAVVLQRKGSEVELGMGTEFEPVCWVIEVAHYQFISLMNHEVGFLHVEDMRVPAHQDSRAAIQLITVYVERLTGGGPAFKDD